MGYEFVLCAGGLLFVWATSREIEIVLGVIVTFLCSLGPNRRNVFCVVRMCFSSVALLVFDGPEQPVKGFRSLA